MVHFLYFRSVAAGLFHRSQIEDDLEEELRSHIQLSLLGVLATWIPAQRALSIDPVILLREE